MIGITSFTHRLGNQIWQLAVADSLAKVNEDSVAYPRWSYSEYFEGDFTPVNKGIVASVWHEPHFHYALIEYRKHMNIQGYYQSYKYLNEELIQEKFKFKKDILEGLRETHKELLDQPNCSIHVRRGDYVTLPNHHPVITMEYIMKAVKEFPKEIKFLVFSDDTEWCKANFPALNSKFFVIEGQTDVEDLALQTICENNIIANSSYSWWGAYLNTNPDKKVVAPEHWFGTSYAHYETKDMHPESWIRR